MPPKPPNQMPLRIPLLIYDGDCPFCRFWVERLKNRIGTAVSFAPYQEAARQFPEIPLERFQAAAQFRDADGHFYSGAEAVFRALACAPGASRRWLLWTYTHVPPYAVVSEAIYRWIARHRVGLYRLTRWVWGERLAPPR